MAGGVRPRWRDGLVNPRAVPSDFEEVFVQIGRLECREHYHVGRMVIDHWLERSGKRRLIDLRADYVRNKKQEKAKLSRREMQQILSVAFPSDPVSDAIARRAAHFLRHIRRGGWIISPAGNGEWWVGARRRSAADLIALARAKGFDQ